MIDKISIRNLIYTFYHEALKGIKEFNKSYKLFLYDQPRLLIFPLLLTLLISTFSLTGINQHLIYPLITHSFILEIFTLINNYNHAPLILLMIFTACLFYYLIISLNTALSLHRLEFLNNKSLNISKSLIFAFKKSFKKIPWIIAATLLTITLQKIYNPYTMNSFIYLLYIISLILWYLFLTLININFIIKDSTFIYSLQSSLTILLQNKIKLLGIFFYLACLSSISFLGKVANWLTVSNSSLHTLSYIIYIPIFVVFLLFSTIILGLFTAITLLATQWYYNFHTTPAKLYNH